MNVDFIYQLAGAAVFVHVAGCCGCVNVCFRRSHPWRFAATAVMLSLVCLGAGAVALGCFGFGGKALVVGLLLRALIERRSVSRDAPK